MGHKCWHLHLSLIISILLWNSAGAQQIKSITPNSGGINGGTRLTINGEGFAEVSQFGVNVDDPINGNNVTLVSRTRSIPCDVENDSSHSKQIVCYTRALPEDHYDVSVNGTPVTCLPYQSTYKTIYSYLLKTWKLKYMLYTSLQSGYGSTPTIQSLSPHSGLPGTVVTIRGNIYTDVYGSNAESQKPRFVRAYMGGMSCELLKPNSEEKSLPDLELFNVSSLNKLAMFQTYAEVTGVSPSEGSVLGGTSLTIQGRYFDKTNLPAVVLVGGQECQIQNVSDEKIVCLTPGYERTNMTVFPGSRGLRMEMWNNSDPIDLEDVLDYNASMSGYSVQWVDSLSYVFPAEMNNFVARLSGFFVPMETDNYYFLIKGDYRCMLYFSLTGLSQDKVRIAYHDNSTYSFYDYTSQKSEIMRLKKGKPYYIEVLVQEYYDEASVDVGFFKEISTFTYNQTKEAINEKQQINASYDVLPEKQVREHTEAL
ncbi:fibrocystin-L-like [Misgurnus anguillicaudatus]|uniref:fibrocystin-L-like n=1 Tax=Misgurnus anguillicaudatus TaxID=75329 RepID=UPI003CCFC84A